MSDVIRVRAYNDDGTRTDRNPLTRTIIGVDSESWDIPLSPGVTSANPNVAIKGWHSDTIFVAADDNGTHKEIIHDGSRREATNNQARNYGLPTERCLEFLLNLPQDAIAVGFYFNYDVTKLCADLPLENMRELCNEDIISNEEYTRRVQAIANQYGLPLNYVHRAGLISTASTVYKGYLIQYTARKQFTVTDLNAGRIWVKDKFRDNNGNWKTDAKGKMEWKRHVIVWDVYTFFQKSFVRALEDYRCGQCAACVRARNKYACNECDRCRADKTCIEIHCLKAPWQPEDLERIAEMKLHRGAFDPSEQDEIVRYCIDECRYLAFLVRDLLIAIDSFGLELSRFDGSGAIASAWLKANKIKNYLPNRVDNFDDDMLRDTYLSGLPENVALCSYFGGRFEISEIGYMGTLYGYDINSAYPAITVTLPCLAHGHFERATDYMPGYVGVYLAGSETSGKYAPFPFRTDDSIDTPGMVKDAIYYCHGGKRWIWQDEIAIARKHFGNDAIPIHDGWIWIPDGCDCEPFSEIPGMYKLRQQYVIDGNGVEKVIKLILNSLYGKTAQSIGWDISNKTGEKKPPPFQCFIWAGLITSGCRAMILDAVMQPGADVVSIATDGILSRTPINLDAPKEKILGKWDADIVSDGYLFQSGVYTYVKEKGGKFQRKYATRGFSAREIPAEQLIAAYQNGESRVNANPTETRFIPLKSGVLREGALEYIGQWIPSIHDVSFNHNRRLASYGDVSSFDDFGDFTRHSEPCVVPNDKESAPYTPKQTWEDVMENQLINEAEYVEAKSW